MPVGTNYTVTGHFFMHLNKFFTECTSPIGRKPKNQLSAKRNDRVVKPITAGI